MKVIGLVLGTVFIGGLLGLLWAIVRFSVISPRITRGARERLRKPDAAGIEALCGFPPAETLLELYRTAPFIEMVEFTLLDRSKTPPVEWEVAGFDPVTRVDVQEGLKVSGVKGIPIASDGNKGTYYVNSSGAVLLSSPNVTGGIAEVAPDTLAFAKFEIRPPEDEEE